MNDLPPLEPAPNAPAPRLLPEDVIDDQPDPRPSPAALEKEREHAMRAEYAWDLWNAEAKAWTPQRLLITPARWSWWKAMRTHNAQPLETEEGVDLDALMPNVWSLLFLGLHSDVEILDLVVSPQGYWRAVNAWAETHCPIDRWHRAHEVTNAIRENIITLLTAPKPSRHSRRLGE